MTTYYHAHKEEKLKYQKDYYEKNKASIKEKDQIRNKQYYEEHKEEKLGKGLIWREANKSLIICGCGSEFMQYHTSKHLESKKHQAYLQQQNMQEVE